MQCRSAEKLGKISHGGVDLCVSHPYPIKWIVRFSLSRVHSMTNYFSLKSRRKLKFFLLFTPFLLAFLGFSIIVFSPYKKDKFLSHKLINESILINTSCEAAYKYLGNSNNSSAWSVYVDHISPINEDIVADGDLGSIRRCFKKNNEKDGTWDEEILFIEKNKLRRLSCFNFQDLTLKPELIYTEQIYEDKNGDCLLKFTLFSPKNELSLWEEFKFYLGSYPAASIFRKNLKNIKKHLEQ